jgi:hypothetical protein
MKLGNEDKKKLALAGVLGACALYAVYYMYSSLSGPDVPATPPAPVVVSAPARTSESASGSATGAGSAAAGRSVAGGSGRVAGKVGTTSAQYDPTLKMEAMLVTESLVYSGSGRNIFSANSAPPAVVIPKAIASARLHAAAQAAAQVPTGPPPLPPIDLKFFGVETRANGTRQAFLLHGEDVFLASAGDVVQRRYKVGNISASSIEVEDLTDNNQQTLVLQKQ